MSLMTKIKVRTPVWPVRMAHNKPTIWVDKSVRLTRDIVIHDSMYAQGSLYVQGTMKELPAHKIKSFQNVKSTFIKFNHPVRHKRYTTIGFVVHAQDVIMVKSL